jgi:hypothetical protein
VDRLLFIQGAQRLGCGGGDPRSARGAGDRGVRCEPAEGLLRRHVDEIDAEMTRLAALRSELVGILTQMPGPDCPNPEPGTSCPPELSEPEGR